MLYNTPQNDGIQELVDYAYLFKINEIAKRMFDECTDSDKETKRCAKNGMCVHHKVLAGYWLEMLMGN